MGSPTDRQTDPLHNLANVSKAAEAVLRVWTSKGSSRCIADHRDMPPKTFCVAMCGPGRRSASRWRRSPRLRSRRVRTREIAVLSTGVKARFEPARLPWPNDCLVPVGVSRAAAATGSNAALRQGAPRWLGPLRGCRSCCRTDRLLRSISALNGSRQRIKPRSEAPCRQPAAHKGCWQWQGISYEAPYASASIKPRWQPSKFWQPSGNATAPRC
jgi:hypothetical protein